jgi:hypothetical protein
MKRETTRLILLVAILACTLSVVIYRVAFAVPHVGIAH